MTAPGGHGDVRALTRRRAQVGGKAASLEAARSAGMSVPPFFVLEPAEASSPDRETLIPALDELGPGAVAVRSSAIAEDGEVSFAGQLESAIGVEGVDAVLDAIGKVGSSGTTGRAKAYGERLASSAGSVAVIVQRLVDSEWAGVAFLSRPPDISARDRHRVCSRARRRACRRHGNPRSLLSTSGDAGVPGSARSRVVAPACRCASQRCSAGETGRGALRQGSRHRVGVGWPRTLATSESTDDRA